MMCTINRILLVDDEATFRQTLRRHLKREGFELETAADGEAACREISRAAERSHPFDLVITDVLMPEMDGIQLLTWIKECYPGISVIVLTGFGDGDSVSRAVRPAIDGFGAKPITPGIMMALIARIDRHRARKRSVFTEDRAL
jgi:DNA-binding NtrC family response regulator